MIDAVGSAKVPETSGAASGLSANQTVSQQQFLILFVEQLKNQDPLSPLEPDQLTAQLAQFSQLEQLTGINTRLDTLTASTDNGTNAALLTLLGKQVTVDGGQIDLEDGVAPEVRYHLDEAAEQVTATVRSSDGTAVRVVEVGATVGGDHTFVFDGKGKQGQTLPDGTYKIEISARAAGEERGTAVPLTTVATVDGVDLAGDPPTLLVRGQHVTIDQIREVRAPNPDA